ncbi:MAG: hypothetical protein PHD95_05590 [Candidatus ainarchaeum sp.]|nr:hypothetical protein [Candidatus ainarchaeum sp.]
MDKNGLKLMFEPKILELNQNKKGIIKMKKKIFSIAIIAAIGLLLTMGCLGSPDYAKPEICEKISSQETKEQCYWETATISKSTELCEKISNLQNRDLCYKDIATGIQHWPNAID